MNHHNNDDHIHVTSSIILAIDVGSSSVRCTAYLYSGKNDTIDTIPVGDGCSSSIQRSGVEPTTGTIRTNGLLEAVDSTVDEVLSKLRARFEDDEKMFTVEAVGFSTFAMNFIAVNDRGRLIPFDHNAGSDDDKNGKAMFETEGTMNTTSSNRHQNTTTVGISYACNSPEVHAECQRLRQELGPDALDKLYQATGAPLHSAYALPQLRVLYNEGKSRLEGHKNHRWQSITGYCLSRWTNRKHLPITFSEASWTGLLNVRDCVFEESAIRWLPPDCRAALPELADFTDCVLGIPQFLNTNKTSRNPYWKKFPELRETKFFLGIGDGACANVGSKCTTSSRIAVTVGTSAAVRMCLRHQASSLSSKLPFRIPECRGLFCYRIDRNHVLVGGALTDGGSIVEWASRFLNLEKDESAFQRCLTETRELVEAEYKEEQTNRHRNLIMAPFLSGERSTGFRDGAAGAIFGLTRDTTSAHFFKSCLEGVSLRLKAVIDLLLVVVDCKKIEDRDSVEDKNADNIENTNTPLPVMVASGKAMEVNHLWRQMIADSSGLRVVLDEDTAEGTSRGVARLVAISLLAEKEAADSEAKSSASARCNNDTDKKQKQKSLPAFAQHEEELYPFLTSEPRPIATAMYGNKLRLQEGFIDSITPFFCSL